MTRNVISIFFIVCLVGSFVGSHALAQGPKIGYVNSAKILMEFPEAIEANKKLDATGKKWQAELEKMSKDFQTKYEEYQKKEPLLKEEEKRSRQADLTEQQQKVLQYRSEKFGNDGELALATDSLLRPIKLKVMKVIEQVAKEQKIQFMFDRNEQIIVLLYGDTKFDYTNLVIDRLKRGNISH